MSPSKWRKVEEERKALSGDFCRGCGYCMPCTVGIQINDCNRMSLFLRRAPLSVYLTEEWAEKMKVIEQCVDCGACKERCPYGLDIPNLLRRNNEDFQRFWNNKKSFITFANDMWCPKGLNRESGVNPGQFPLLCRLDACH